MKKFKVLFWLFLISISHYSYPFEPNFFKKLDPNLDISHQSIRAVTQDHDGFIWLGTQEGLSRFDGYQVITYHHELNNVNSLSHNIISSLITDKSGRIWVGTRGGGLNLFLANSNHFKRFNTQLTSHAIINNNITTLFEDSQGAIWIGTEKGLNKLRINKKNTEIVNISPLLLGELSIRAIIEVNDQIWVGTENSGIFILSLTGEFIKQLKHTNNEEQTIPANIIRALLSDHKGNIWIGTIEGGLTQYDPVADHYRHYKNVPEDLSSLSSNIVTNIFEDSDNRLWIGTDKGLNIFNYQQNRFQRFVHANNDINSLSNNMILTIFEDKGKMIWLGTFGGLNRWDPNVATFKQFNIQNKSGLNNNGVHTFTQLDRDNILIGTYGGGVNQLNVTTHQISQPAYNAQLKDKRIMAILSHKNEVWLGTRASGVYRINLLTQHIINYQYQQNVPNSLSANSITDIKVDNTDTIWIATYHGGLNRFDGNSGFEHYRQRNSDNSQALTSDHILQILPEGKETLWLATDGGGLNKLNTTTKQVISYHHNEHVANSISNDVAWSLFLDNKNNLWVGTEASGLNIWHQQDRRDNKVHFDHININHGMKSSTVFAITQDDNGDFWFNTNKGVSRYSPNSKSFMHFDTSHGLLDLEFNFQAILKTNQNHILFGSAKGFNLLNPNNLLSNQHAPDVRLTNIYSLNKKMQFDKPLSQIKYVEFDYTDKLIAFEYTGLDYASPESNLFKYRLKGFDKQWINAGKLRRATYTNLNAGEYQLEIIAANNFGVWGNADVNLTIRVHPAPWNTWWAYIGYACILGLSLLFYSRFMTRKLISEQEQRAQLKKEVLEKTQEFKNQNIQLIKLNQELESSAIIDKLTSVKSRRYLDIYIEQTSRLMTQIHHNISQSPNALLPRLYLILIKVAQKPDLTDKTLINVAEFLQYKCDQDDLVVRWSHNVFAVIGSEKDKNVSMFASSLAGEKDNIALNQCTLTIGYSFFPFDLERPQSLNWDQTSIIAEIALNNASQQNWLGIYQPCEYPFDFNQLLQEKELTQIKSLVTVKYG